MRAGDTAHLRGAGCLPRLGNVATALIELLGRFSVALDDVPVPPEAWRSRRGADLVKLLALAPDHRLPRGVLMEQLWPESDPHASGTNLRKAVHFARLATGGPRVVDHQQDVLVLWPGAEVHTDVEAFESAAHEAITTGEQACCRAAATAYRSGLLPEDRYQEWVAEPRERLHRLYLDVLRAGGLWDLLLRADPTDEQAARALMAAHLDAGQRREAIRCFEHLREALRDRLGLGPDPDTVALLERALAAEGAPQPTPQERAHALLARALMHANRGEVQAGEEAADRARSIALDAGLGRELGEAATILAKTAMMQGVWQQRFADELVESMRSQAQLEPIVYDAHLCVAEYYLTGADGRAGAATLARRMMTAADEARSATGGALALLMLGEARLLDGQLDQAEQDLRKAARANEELGCLSGAALARQRLAEAALTRGHFAAARRLLARARTLASRSEIVAHLLVRVYDTSIRAAPDPAAAMTVVREAERELARVPSCEPCSMGYLTTAATATARAGRLPRARSFLAEAERISGMWQAGLWTGAVWEARGHLRRAEGDDGRARAMFAEAAEAFTQAGDPRAAARCQHAAAGPASTTR